MNQDHLGRNTLLTQTGEHLQGLVHPAAVVGVGVDKQGGSGDIADVLQGRLVPEDLALVPDDAFPLQGIEAHVLQQEQIPLVTGGDGGDKVGNAPHGTGSLEPLGVADDPVGHVAAIGPAAHAQPIRVHVRITAKHLIGEVHQILVIDGAPPTYQIEVILPPTVAAVGICIEHEPTAGGQQLHLMVVLGTVGRLGAAVNVQYAGILLPRLVSGGADDPAIHLLTVPAAERDVLRT